MHGRSGRKAFVDLTLTEEASLLDVTLVSGGLGGDGWGHGYHGHGHGHGHGDAPKAPHGHGHGGDF